MQIFIKVLYDIFRLRLADDMNASIANTNKLLRYVGKILSLTQLFPADIWPKNHDEALNFLTLHGYDSPKESNVCFDMSHPLQYYNVSDKEVCPECEKQPEIKLYYLPLKEKVRRWFSSVDTCNKMLGHWRDKETWINSTEPTFPLKELWHGKRFKELKWFWDPNSEWFEPVYQL